MASTDFQNIDEIIEAARQITDVNDMIKFVEAGNAKLARPLDNWDLNRKIHNVSTHIIKTHKKVDNEKRGRESENKGLKVSSASISEDIDRINDSLDIVDLIRSSPKALNFQGSGDRYTAHTNRNSQSGASLIITPSEQKWHDKATGEGGLAFNWIAYELIGTSSPRGKDVIDVLEVAAEKAGITLSNCSEEDKALYQEKEEIITLLEKVNERWVNNLQNNPEILEDLKNRHGLTAEQAKDHGVGYSIGNEDLKGFDDEILIKSGLVYSKTGNRENAFFQHRITYSYFKNGRPVYFIGRLTKNTPDWDRGENDHNKYKKLQTYSEKHPYVSKAVQNNTIYGQDSIRGKNFFVITEGIGDCLSLHCAEIPSISPITTQFPKHDIPKLLDLARGKDRVYIVNDNETPKDGEEVGAGEKGALTTAKTLEKEGITAIIVILPRPEGQDKIDVAEFMRDNSKDDFVNLLTSENAFGLWEYILHKKKKPESSKSIEKIRAFRAFIENDLSDMKQDEWEIFVTNEVKDEFKLTKKEVQATVKEVSEKRSKALKTAQEKPQEQQEDKGDGEEENTKRELPPLEERLKEYPEEVIEKANEILGTGDPFLYICDTWNKIHVGDKNLGEMLACSVTCTQVLNAGLGIHEKPSGDAESGKSHACLSMGKLFPSWKFRSTTFSPKVLYYMKDLLPGTIIYTDDIDLVDKGVISTIKKVTADFEEPTIMDTVIDGKPAKLSIPERLGIWLSSCDSIDDVQLGTRFIFSNTESGEEHDHEVNHKQKGRCLGAIPEVSNKDVLICRCMLEYICNNLYNVFSAYGFVSTWSEESKKRNQEKFLDVLLAVTVFNYRQRETIHGNLIGTLDDWKRAVSIYSHVAQNNSCMLTDEEIVILHTIHEMQKYFEEGVPHKRLFTYMKETNKFKKSDSSLKRILLGDRAGGKQGFKEKVPGFTFEKIDMPKLDENGLEVRGEGKTRALCYSYDGDLFDGLPEGVDVVNAIKNGIFVNCDYEIAEALEQAFKDDPEQVYKLKDNSGELEKWKREARNQKKSSEFIRNSQKSKALNSEKTIQTITNNNNKNDDNKLRNHKIEDKVESEKNNNISSQEMDINTYVSEHAPKNMNSVNSVASEPATSDQTLNSEPTKLNSETSEIRNHVNSDIVSLLKRALIKFAQDEYSGIVQDTDEFIRMFNKRVPEYKKALGPDAVGYNANKLHMRGWK